MQNRCRNLVFNANTQSDETIYSRAGIHINCLSLDSLETVAPDTSCILVDECHFLTKDQVEFLRELSMTKRIPVICYGLRTDFNGELFEASKRLLELADSIEEIKTTCWFCERKATMNLRLIDSDEKILIEKPGEQKYVPACYKCWEMNK